MTNPSVIDIRDAANAALRSVEEKWGNVVQVNLTKRFIAAATLVGDLDHYKFFPEAASQLIELVCSEHGIAGQQAFLRAVLLQAVLTLIETKSLDKLPPKISHYQRFHLYRIANDATTDMDWLDISHDYFHKEFGLATLRLYAAGAQLIDVRCGIPRSILFAQGIAEFPIRLLKMLKLGGFKPYFQIHTHKLNLDQFNEKGWNECYRGCAELYALYPKSLGMFGSSWFYDPALEEISPRLGYLRNIPVEGGAALMFYSEGGDAIGDSTATSPSRRELYEAGRYMPKSYMLIWGRDSQINWAYSHRDD